MGPNSLWTGLGGIDWDDAIESYSLYGGGFADGVLILLGLALSCEIVMVDLDFEPTRTLTGWPGTSDRCHVLPIRSQCFLVVLDWKWKK